jgi:predicted Zn-dependent protease
VSSARQLVIVCVAALSLAAVLIACAVNPATGKRQLVLISEADEIAIGRQNDQAMVQSLGLYDDEKLQAYVQDLGRRMAAKSERPHLDWTFRVVDDPVVNAFALPGGFVYITRGILAHMNSEAELAGVVGHEIGHVTARHGVNQMSKQQLAQLGMGLGMAVSEDFRAVADLAGQGLGLLFLKYSRDDERQADDLGLRYMSREGYDPRPMADFYSVLREVGEAAGASPVPSLFSTHPQPENRRERLHEEIAELGQDFSDYPTGRRAFLQHIDGLVYGNNPREGFFDGNVFKHPELAFRIDFPEGWQTRNARTEVAGVGPDRDVMVRLAIAAKDTAAASLDAFLGQEGITAGESWRREIRGHRVASTHFAANSSSGPLRGIIAFVEYEGRVFELLGIAVAERWAGHADDVKRSLGSFSQLTDRRDLSVQPSRIEVVQPDRDMSIDELGRRFDASVPVETLALINHLEPDDLVRRGELYKVVAGGPGAR